MADAYARGDRGFLLGNGTGTGKTFVALGVVKQLEVPRTLIVVPNQAIAKQWQDAARAHFGLAVTVGAPTDAAAAGVYIATYAGLADQKKGRRRPFSQGGSAPQAEFRFSRDVSRVERIYRQALSYDDAPHESKL
jgi:superfamily II DNA or RNA helicase